MVKNYERRIMDIIKGYANAYSGDAKTKVGAGVVINGNLYMGTNHLGKDIPVEDIITRSKVFYDNMIHAEIDMLTKYDVDITGKTVYVTLFPCDNCARNLIARGVGRIVAGEDRPDASYIIAAKVLLDAAGVEYEVL